MYIQTNKYSHQFKSTKKCVEFVLVLLGIALFFPACAQFKNVYRYDFLEGKNNQKIIVSKNEPIAQFICTPLGFLPCSLNSVDTDVNKDVSYLQCAKNILPYANNIEANYILIQEPIQILGISWRDAKANLYKCQWLPQPQQNITTYGNP